MDAGGGGSQLTSDEPEAVENTGENSTVFRVGDLGDIAGSCGCRHGYSDTENETPTLELRHGVGWRLDAGADDDERGWQLRRVRVSLYVCMYVCMCVCFFAGVTNLRQTFPIGDPKCL